MAFFHRRPTFPRHSHLIIKMSNDLMAKGALAEPLLTENQFSALILKAFVTTFMAPLTLRWSVLRTCRAEEKAAFSASGTRPKRDEALLA